MGTLRGILSALVEALGLVRKRINLFDHCVELTFGDVSGIHAVVVFGFDSSALQKDDE